MICYDIYEVLSDEIDRERDWNNDMYYNSELVWKLLKKYKGIKMSKLEIIDGKKAVSVQAIYESKFLEKVEKN